MKQQEKVAAQRAEYQRKAEIIEGFARSGEPSKSLRTFAARLASDAEWEGIPEEQRRGIRARRSGRSATQILSTRYTDNAQVQESAGTYET